MWVLTSIYNTRVFQNIRFSSYIEYMSTAPIFNKTKNMHVMSDDTLWLGYINHSQAYSPSPPAHAALMGFMCRNIIATRFPCQVVVDHNSKPPQNRWSMMDDQDCLHWHQTVQMFRLYHPVSLYIKLNKYKKWYKSQEMPIQFLVISFGVLNLNKYG